MALSLVANTHHTCKNQFVTLCQFLTISLKTLLILNFMAATHLKKELGSRETFSWLNHYVIKSKF